jgi:hypothetical protein
VHTLTHHEQHRCHDRGEDHRRRAVEGDPVQKGLHGGVGDHQHQAPEDLQNNTVHTQAMNVAPKRGGVRSATPAPECGSSEPSQSIWDRIRAPVKTDYKPEHASHMPHLTPLPNHMNQMESTAHMSHESSTAYSTAHSAAHSAAHMSHAPRAAYSTANSTPHMSHVPCLVQHTVHHT